MRNLFNQYGEKLLGTATKSGSHAEKTASKKVVHKANEATGELKGNEISKNIVKSKPAPKAN